MHISNLERIVAIFFMLLEYLAFVQEQNKTKLTTEIQWLEKSYANNL